MPEIEDKVEFDTITNNMVLHTQANGDTLVLSAIHLTKEQAGTLAWLINHPDDTPLKVEIKKV